MRTTGYEDALIDTIKVSDLTSYLEDKGWKEKPSPRQQVRLFEGPPADNGEPIVQVVPATERLRDYRTGVEDLARALSVIEDRPFGDVLWEIATPDCDRVTFRLDSPETRTGAIGFEHGTQFFSQAMALLTSDYPPPRVARNPSPSPLDRLTLSRSARMRILPDGAFTLGVELPLRGEFGPFNRAQAVALGEQLERAQRLLAAPKGSRNLEADQGSLRPAYDAIAMINGVTSDPDAQLTVSFFFGRGQSEGRPAPKSVVFSGKDAGILSEIVAARDRKTPAGAKKRSG